MTSTHPEPLRDPDGPYNGSTAVSEGDLWPGHSVDADDPPLIEPVERLSPSLVDEAHRYAMVVEYSKLLNGSERPSAVERIENAWLLLRHNAGKVNPPPHAAGEFYTHLLDQAAVVAGDDSGAAEEAWQALSMMERLMAYEDVLSAALHTQDLQPTCNAISAVEETLVRLLPADADLAHNPSLEAAVQRNRDPFAQ